MNDKPRVLVLGASGYVGGRLAPRLLDAGYRVRCLARSPEKLRGLAWAERAEVVAGDLLDPGSLPPVFDGVDAAYYLVHSMEGPARSRATAPGSGFDSRDRRAAGNAASAAVRAGLRRLVYLGGLGDEGPDTSAHLRSRAEVGRILADSGVPTTVLRAAVIIGSGSASFEMLRHLVEKLPVMVTPRWVDTRVQPIAIRDVVRYLLGVLDLRDPAGHLYDIGGPDVLSYLEMMQRYARVAGLPRRLIVKVPVLTPALSSHWVNLVTPVPFGLARPLVQSLVNEVVVRRGAEAEAQDITAVVPGRPLGYDAAVALALRRVRDREVETSWREAEIEGRSPAEPYPGDPDWAGGTLLTDLRRVAVDASPEATFAAISRVGGDRGWPSHMWAWRLRGRVDRLLGGVGLRRGRRDPDRLRVGDALDFWRVEATRAPRGGAGGLLRLRAEMRLPGQAWLEFRVDPGRPPASRLTQRALFAPRGVLGRLYWWALLPFHGAIFSSMARALGRDAERLAGGVTSTGERTAPPGALVSPGGRPAPGAAPPR